MFRYNFLPYRREAGRLVLVMADPTDIPVVDELTLLLQTPIQPAVGTPTAIQEALKRGQGTQRVLEEASESFKIQILRDDDNGDEVLSIDKIQADASPIIRLVDSTVFDALNRRASDIHIETRDDRGGDQVPHRRRAPAGHEADRQGAPLHHHQPHQGHGRAGHRREARAPGRPLPREASRGRSVDFRVSIMPSVHGEDAVIRILDKESLSKQFASLRLDVLGFDEKELARFRRFIREPYGMVLVTGPHRLRQDHHPLRRPLARSRPKRTRSSPSRTPSSTSCRGITQIPVNEKKGLTFARGLRSILRHDPDKIMVGEIRDAETADIAIQSALTGHLVFTTVHANNVIDVLGRFLNMKIEPYNFVSALNCVQAQRLVRTICAHCKRAGAGLAGAAGGVGPGPRRLRATCRSTRARAAWSAGAPATRAAWPSRELLDLSDRVRELILARRSSAEIKRAAREEGMVFLRESAVQQGAGRPDHAARDQQGDVRGGRRDASLRRRPAGGRRARPRPRAPAGSGGRGRGRRWLRRHAPEPQRPLVAVEVRPRSVGVVRLRARGRPAASWAPPRPGAARRAPSSSP